MPAFQKVEQSLLLFGQNLKINYINDVMKILTSWKTLELLF